MNDIEQILDLLIQSYDKGQSLYEVLDSEMIKCLSYSNSLDVRVWLARALAYCISDISAVAVLQNLSQDKYPCVRVEAIDSLSGFANLDSFYSLCNASSDENELVRAYSAFGIALVGKTVASQKAMLVLSDMAKSERSNRVLVNIYEGQYILGKTEMLVELINLFASPDYHVQCAVVHALGELLCNKTQKTIKQFIDGLNMSDYSHAVADALEQLNARCM